VKGQLLLAYDEKMLVESLLIGHQFSRKESDPNSHSINRFAEGSKVQAQSDRSRKQG
jgi:hypothetical protein